jgi:hypothetical protein
MVSRTHFFTEFDFHLVDLTLVSKVHNSVRMGLRGVDELLFPIVSPRLLGEMLGKLQVPTIYTDGPKTEDLVGIGIFLDDRDSHRFRLPGHCGIFTMGAYIILTVSLASIEELKSTGISYRTNDMLFREPEGL